MPKTMNFRTVVTITVLWRCWLGGRKDIRPVKHCGGVLVWLFVCGEVQICISYGPANPTATHYLMLQKSRLVLVLPFWYRLTRVVPDKIQRAVKRLW